MNGSKSWLIVKSEALADEAKRVFGDEVNKQLKVSAIKEQSLRRKNTKINIVRRKFAYGKRKSNGSTKLKRVSLTQRTLPSQKGTS